MIAWFLTIAGVVVLLTEDATPPNEVGYALLAAGTAIVIAAIVKGGRS